MPSRRATAEPAEPGSPAARLPPRHSPRVWHSPAPSPRAGSRRKEERADNRSEVVRVLAEYRKVSHSPRQPASPSASPRPRRRRWAPGQEPEPDQPAGKFVLGGRTLRLPGVASDDGPAYRAEALRAFLEGALPGDELFAAYAAVRDGDGTRCSDTATARALKRIVGRARWHYITLLQQLVIVEDY